MAGGSLRHHCEQRRGQAGFDVCDNKCYMDSMIQNSSILLDKMCLGCKYTYNELLKICEFTETQLCFAILYLLKDGKISQYRDNGVIYELVPTV